MYPQPGNFHCNICGKTFARKFNFDRHRVTHYHYREQYQCRRCPRFYPRRYHLKRHYEAVHNRNTNEVNGVYPLIRQVRPSPSAQQAYPPQDETAHLSQMEKVAIAAEEESRG